MAVTKKNQRQGPGFPVVGIGASAGGIIAMRNLFKTLPQRTGLAFVVVQHLPPEHPSQLADLLGKSTALPVCEAVDGMKVEHDHIYTIPPGAGLTLEKGRLRCRPFCAGHTGIDSIDTFFESLAAERGRQAIAVALSGTGSDGAAGAIRIKQSGGIVFVQNPLTAQHDGLPRAVIATGTASHILPVEAIARELVACAAPASVQPVPERAEKEDSAPSLDKILTLIRRQADIDLSGYKFKPLFWQIQQRMKIRRIEHYDDYEDLLHDDPAELEALIRDIPIHVTEFFRDAEAWDVLRREVIAPLILKQAGERAIRAWTPACSSGEEAYSVAMLLAEQAGQRDKPADFQIFATDASFEIVNRASRGQYSSAAIEAMPSERKARFFYPVDSAYRVKKSLREKIVFSPQHLLADPPFSDLDLITCRNLLIYLEPSAQQELLSMLHASLRMGGCLFLGSGESLSSKQQGFEVISSRWRIYRKTGPAADIRIKFPKRLKHFKPSAAMVEERAHWAVLEKFDLPSVLIDDQFNILRVYGDTTAFLRLPPGRPTLNLMQVAQPALVTNLWIAADRALAQYRAVNVGGLRDNEAGDFSLRMRLTPIHSGEGGGTPRLLISFLRSSLSADLALTTGRRTVPAKGSSAAEGFEGWSDAFQLFIEELEASRQELQALNEELRTVNDQLNISNEEVNDVNAQLHAKIQELETQSHVLSSGAVMTLFLDKDLRVRWFTPAVSELFPLMPSDTGRQITELVPRFVDPHFIDDVKTVMRGGEPLEDEVRNVESRWYLRRIGPFRTDNETITGVAITFTDITQRKQAEEQLRQGERRFRQVVESLPQLVWTCQPEGPCDYLSPQWVNYTGIPESQQLGYGWLEPLHPDDRQRTVEHWQATVGAGDHFSIEFRIRRHDGIYRWFHTLAVPLRDETGHIVKWFGSNTDIDDWKQTSEALHESKDYLRFALEIGHTGTWDLDLVDQTAHRSLEHDRIFGYDHLLPRWTYEMFLEHVVPEDRPAVDAKFHEAMAAYSEWNFECRIRRADGEVRWIWAAGRHREDSGGIPRRMAGIIQDITERKQ